MNRVAKNAQLQIRVTDAQKSAIQHAAERAGMDMSTYVLNRLLPPAQSQFADRVAACVRNDTTRHALAELNSFLSALSPLELRDAVATAPAAKLSPYLANTIAAMVELGCALNNIPVPTWTREVPPLAEPVFGTNLLSLRLYLLTHSPAPFRRRNIFVDSSLGDRV